MVVLRIGNLELGNGVTHLSTVYEVATDIQFTNLIINVNDTVNLTTKVLDNVLDPTVYYYARTKCLLSTGYSYYSNIHKFKPQDTRQVDFDIDTPSVLGLPRITSSALTSSHQPTLFTLNVSGFTTVGNAKLESTTWLIEDIDGNIVWERLRDSVNKTSITVTDIILKNNKVYRIRSIFHSTSGDSSQVATLTILTGVNKYTKLLTTLNNVVVINLKQIKLLYKPLVTQVEYEIVNITEGVITVISSVVQNNGDIFTHNITPGILVDNKTYILKVKTNLDTVWNYIPFSTY